MRSQKVCLRVYINFTGNLPFVRKNSLRVVLKGE